LQLTLAEQVRQHVRRDPPRLVLSRPSCGWSGFGENAMTSKKLHICIVIGESGDYEVATDEYAALDRLKDGSGEDLTGTVCRIVQLNVTTSQCLSRSAKMDRVRRST
jgi:hypothetical protein